MSYGAPRRPARAWQRLARGAAVFLVLVGASTGSSTAQEITGAQYAQPTAEYPHGVLGDDLEWKELRVTVTKTRDKDNALLQTTRSQTFTITAPADMVFEDTAPRLWDVTGDGKPEVVIVQSSQTEGARLLIVGLLDGGTPEYIAGTGHIGTRFRWLAPVGAADLDGDGYIEIAFVDRPHLAKTLRIWRYSDTGFGPVATLGGVSNHRIGEDYITGGVRDCGAGPEVIVVDGAWRDIVAVRLTADEITGTRIAPFEGRSSVDAQLACP